MLPRLQSTAQISKAALYEPADPPEIKPTRGVENLKNLKDYSDRMFLIHKDLVKEAMLSSDRITRLMSTNNDLRADQASKLTLISDLKSKLENEKMLTRSREESERLMLLEIKLRKNVESELEKTKILLRDERLAFFKFKQTISDNSKQLEVNNAKVKDIERNLYLTNREKVDLQFVVDGLRVDIIKIERSNETLQSDMKEYTKKNLELVEVAENLTLENSVLQKKVRELLDANKDVTINYQVIKKNYDSRKKEAEEVAKESDEAKNACQLLIKQKRSQREEIEGLVKQKVQLESSLSSAKSELMALSAENEDLQNRIKELEIEEERLKKQIRSSSRIKSSSTNLLKSSNGNLMKNSTSDLLKNSRMDLLKNSNGNLLNGSTHSLLKGLTSSMLKENSDIEISKAPEVQEEAVTDFDKQALLNTFQLKMDETINEMKFEFEKIQSQLCDELDFTQENLEERIMESAKLESVIKKLQEEQYLPRMQYLHTLEVEMKEKLLDLAMEDEKMELNLICPRDLKLLDRATTLSPCGHSFCKTCVKQMSLENFDQLKCDVCKTKTSETFSNYKLDQLKEQLLERKKKMKVILAW